MDGLHYMPALGLSLADLTEVFNAAFEGYIVPMRHTPESLETMLLVNDIHLGASRLVRSAADEPVGIALLGVRGGRGWVGGMAVVPHWRGQGIGTGLLSALLESARDVGLETVQLEVLDQNTAARHLYTRLGFEDVRSLVVYAGAFTPRQVPSAQQDAFAAIGAEEAGVHFDQVHRVPSPWQRERASLLHLAQDLDGLGLRDADGVRAYLLWMPSGGGCSLLDFGCRPASTGQMTADALALLAELHARHPGAIRAINIASGDPLGEALTALGCSIAATQREMVLRLR